MIWQYDPGEKRHKRVPKNLDQLSEQAASVSSGFSDDRAFDQGYRLAEWLRGVPGVVAAGGSVDPEELLERWNVELRDISIPSDSIDAVCCWGPKHGPAILVNTSGPRSRFPTGRRSTLAHEICHLLVDRQASLPLGEVLGGKLSKLAEQRANAFAAEFLLPRDLAFEAVTAAQDVEAAVTQLSQDYRVSHEVAAWQIMNAGANLPPDEERYLKGLSYRHRPM